MLHLKKSTRIKTLLAVLVAVLAWYSFAPSASVTLLSAPAVTAESAPEFTSTDAASWINSAPLTLADLRGYVVLIDFWTFDCWNCYRSFPWLNEIEASYRDRGLRVVGVHTPEFEHEKERGRVIEKTQEFKLRHPVMMDNQFRYWNAVGNRYWPAFYLVDRQGRLRAGFAGEVHKGDRNARKIETVIDRLLAERL